MISVIIIVPADIFSNRLHNKGGGDYCAYCAYFQVIMIKYTKVAVLGANSPEWFSCAVGAVMAGGLVRVTIVYVNCNHQTSYYCTCVTKLTR